MEKEKYVDESWKDTVAEEQRKARHVEPSSAQSALAGNSQAIESTAKKEVPPDPQTEISFIEYLSSLAYQAMIFLGEVPHPASGLPEKDLRQAKIFIETLVLLRHKTRGNLNKQEEDTLNASLYELQMRFVELAKQEGGA